MGLVKKNGDDDAGIMRTGAAAYSHAMKKKACGGFIKSDEQPQDPPFVPIWSGKPAVTPAAPQSDESKYRRVAKFLILIGSERAAEIFSQLDSKQVEKISKEITSISSISGAEGEAILTEFRSLLSSPFGYSGGVSGGVEAARRLLYAAYGPEKGEQILGRAVPEARANLFDFLEDFSGDQLAMLFREEPPGAAALVFSQLPPKLSAAALACITGEKKMEIVRRIAKHAPVAPEVLEQIAGALREKARHIAGAKSEGFDGMNALTAILKSADASFGDSIIRELEHSDPDLGKIIKERIYTLDDIVFASDLPIQKKLASMENRDIILLLKARSKQNDADDAGAFREKILSNLSQTRRDDLAAEEEFIGPVPRRDVDKAASDFLGWFRKNREDGHILMFNDKDIVL
jgi:flagellar motor switch protein FliG